LADAAIRGLKPQTPRKEHTEMRKPHGGLWPALIALLAATALSAPASAAVRHDAFPLHAGSTGTRVAAAQWLVSGHRPNVFTKVKPTLKHYTPGVYGARTKSAVVAYKFRIGYPAKGQCGAKTTTLVPTVGRYFFDLLEGRKQRPICWVALAQQRVQLVVPGASPLALKIKAWEIDQLGTHEVPDRSNRGPRISYAPAGWPFAPYQAATGAYGAAWCASLQQDAFEIAGAGTFADRSAGVLYIEAWAHDHGYLNAKAKVGALVAFLDDGGHIGYIVKVLASGYVTVEGNAGGSRFHGGQVMQVYHPWNDRLRVFIYLPGVA
jgi:hypothetical protein